MEDIFGLLAIRPAGGLAGKLRREALEIWGDSDWLVIPTKVGIYLLERHGFPLLTNGNPVGRRNGGQEVNRSFLRTKLCRSISCAPP